MKRPRNPKSITIRAPRARPAGISLFSGSSSGRKPSTKKIYTKNILREDPTNFMNWGFGRTGMTGES
jgi:hypothetical protein